MRTLSRKALETSCPFRSPQTGDGCPVEDTQPKGIGDPFVFETLFFMVFFDPVEDTQPKVIGDRFCCVAIENAVFAPLRTHSRKALETFRIVFLLAFSS